MAIALYWFGIIECVLSLYLKSEHLSRKTWVGPIIIWDK